MTELWKLSLKPIQSSQTEQPSFLLKDFVYHKKYMLTSFFSDYTDYIMPFGEPAPPGSQTLSFRAETCPDVFLPGMTGIGRIPSSPVKNVRAGF